MRPSAPRIARLRSRLLAWYGAHRRPLPWRATSDPYAIWISEAMLQQTRVETVIPYWERFLERFPDVRSLAEADPERVLAAWSGLGYYRRARSLQAAARALVELHQGEFPRQRTQLLALPGIGPYTAGALLSIAFDRGEPLVDGNVERVLCRLFGLDLDPSRGAASKSLWELAGQLVPKRGGAREWNQALMELGATVCTAKAWGCGRCPLAGVCRARREGRVAELPRPRVKPAIVPVELEVALVRASSAGWLLERRPSSGRMAGMWQFPTRERPLAGRGSGLFPADWSAPLALRRGALLGEVRHGITQHRIRASVVSFGATARTRALTPFAWWPAGELEALALTGMTRKILRSAFFPSRPSDPGRRRGIEV